MGNGKPNVDLRFVKFMQCKSNMKHPIKFKYVEVEVFNSTDYTASHPRR
jgi:hypothetical protein